MIKLLPKPVPINHKSKQKPQTTAKWNGEEARIDVNSPIFQALIGDAKKNAEILKRSAKTTHSRRMRLFRIFTPFQPATLNI